MEVNQYQFCGVMPKKIGGPTPNLELVWKEIDRHERILKKMLLLLEEQNEEIQKIKEGPKIKRKEKKGETV